MNLVVQVFPLLATFIPFLCFCAVAFLSLTNNLKEEQAKWLARTLMLFLVAGATINLYSYWHGAETSGVSFKQYQFGHHSLSLMIENSTRNAAFSFCFLLLSTVVAFFSSSYLHKEKSFFEFYYLFFGFVAASQLTVFAANMDSLFIGWELVGICSVLLIGFFKHKENPVASSLNTLIHCRLGEICLLSAITMCHLIYGNEGLGFLGQEHEHVFIILLLIITAVYIKSAQFPFGEWLPRAMEGPTPSSAIFYGGISTHLGPMLLLKLSPLLEQEPGIRYLLVVCGCFSFAYAAIIGRTRSDVKTQIVYASTAQLAMIFIEIGLGYYDLATFHCIVHCTARTFQMLKAPSALLEHESLKINPGPPFFEKLLPERIRSTAIYWSHSRFFVETNIQKFLVQPFFRLSRFAYFIENQAQIFAAGPESIVAPEPTSNVEEKQYAMESK